MDGWMGGRPGFSSKRRKQQSAGKERTGTGTGTRTAKLNEWATTGGLDAGRRTQDGGSERARLDCERQRQRRAGVRN